MTTARRSASMATIAARVETMVHEFSTSTDRHHIRIEYASPTRDDITRFDDWTRKYHGITPGEEYFIIRQDYPDAGRILYTVRVTADSVLTASAELMALASCKF